MSWQIIRSPIALIHRDDKGRDFFVAPIKSNKFPETTNGLIDFVTCCENSSLITQATASELIAKALNLRAEEIEKDLTKEEKESTVKM